MSFTAETLETSLLQGEPDWLRERRQSALATFEKLPAPSKTDEEWRRTDVSRFDPSQFSKLEHLDGQKLLLPSALPEGVILKPLRQAAQEHPDLVEPRLFSLVHAGRDRFTALHAAFFTGGTFLYVPDGVVIDQPIIGQHFSHEGGTSVLPHTLIVAGKNSKFHYLDEYIAEHDDEAGYRSGSTEIFLGEGSQVGYVAVQKWGRNVWHFADQRAELQKDSSLKLFNVTLGGRFSKTRVEASLAGEGSNAELKAIYFASGEQFFGYVLDRIPFEHARKLVEAELESRIG